MISDAVEDFQDIADTEPDETGIDALGIMIVFTFALIAFALFLDFDSELQNWKIGLLIMLSISVYGFAGYNKVPGIINLKKSVMWAGIGFTALGILSTGVAFIWSYFPEGTVYSTLGLVAVLSVISPAVFEELLFRGAAYRVFFEWLQSEFQANVIQAFFFAIFHSWVAGIVEVTGYVHPDAAQYFIVLFLGGMILQYVYLASKNILSPILAHMGNNARALASEGLDSAVIVGVVLVAIIIYAWRRLRR